MHNVIGALRYMAEHGRWNFDSNAGVWYVLLLSERSSSYGPVGFTKKELLDFLEHYDEVTNG